MCEQARDIKRGTIRQDGSSLPVELRGLEPLTPCMPCRCATSCATAPDLLRCGVPPKQPDQLNALSSAAPIGASGRVFNRCRSLPSACRRDQKAGRRKPKNPPESDDSGGLSVGVHMPIRNKVAGPSNFVP
ncbi:hypothetical protein ARTSIC4J27_1817 [Pseudarthrobacter siccitolerans]|uniref:Uncharacterized protein n=1 Tax=Pseudarthrobacter siccitolerans TaxID=861266 RepID=A0A024H271_9MICC|nr:hypothetical protein ARTSIC4J27_1817 [Pseudarthrobacter siccitolerans]